MTREKRNTVHSRVKRRMEHVTGMEDSAILNKIAGPRIRPEAALSTVEAAESAAVELRQRKEMRASSSSSTSRPVVPQGGGGGGGDEAARGEGDSSRAAST